MNTSTFGTSSVSEAREQREGPIARGIEKRAAKLPSDVFLWAAGASILASLAIQVLGLRGRRRFRRDRLASLPRMGSPLANFVGEWAPTLLLLGLYRKMKKAGVASRVAEGIERDMEE